MILRNLTIKIQGNRATTDSPVYLYQYDKNIHLIIDIKNCKYQLENNMYISYTIVKPNNEVVVLTNCFMKNGKVHVILESNLFDGEEEVGTALCQLKLYDNTRTSAIALPPFAIHVLDGYSEPIKEEEVDILLTQDELKLLSENELALRLDGDDTKGSIRISELTQTVEATGMFPVVQNGQTMKYNLGSLATKHYVNDFVEAQVTSEMSQISEQMELVNQMAVSMENKADISDLEEYATKNEVQTKVQSAFDFTTDTYNYATSVGEQALNDAKAYTDNAITNLDVDVDLSAYVTTTQLTTELNKKSDTTHTHDDRYNSTYLINNPINSMDDVQDIYLSANYRHYDVREEGFFENIRIVLPTNLTTGYTYEYHIYFNPTEFSNNTYKKNIFVTGGTVKWQQGTSLEIDSQHIYEIILTYVGGAYSSSRYWLGGVVVYG